MRRATAIRLSVTIDRELAQWLDGYAHDARTTKSIVIETLVSYMREEIAARESEEKE